MIQLLLSKYGITGGVAIIIIGAFGIQRHFYMKALDENMKLKVQIEIMKVQSDRNKKEVEDLNLEIKILDSQRRLLIDQIGKAPRDPAKLRQWLIDSIGVAQ